MAFIHQTYLKHFTRSLYPV